MNHEEYAEKYGHFHADSSDTTVEIGIQKRTPWKWCSFDKISH